MRVPYRRRTACARAAPDGKTPRPFEHGTFRYPFEVLRCPPGRFSRSFPIDHHDAGDGRREMMMSGKGSISVAVRRETSLRPIEAPT